MSEQSDQSEDDFSTRRARIFQRAQDENVPLKTILVTVFTVAAVYLAGVVLFRLRDLLLLMLVGGFVALLLNPLVTLLQRWKVPRRGFAVFIVTFLAVLAFAGLAFAFGYPLVNSTTHLARALPSYIRNAEHGRGWVGHLLRRYHIEKWLHKNSSKLVTFAKGLSKPALALGRGAATVLLVLVTLFAFVVLLLLEGPKIRRASLRMISPQRGAWITKVSSQVSQAAVGYMLGNLTTSLIAGSVIFITLFCLSVPFAFLWALWVALVDFVPQIGGALAGIPTVLFALVHSLTAGIITAVVFLVYTQIENHVLYPIIMSRTVKINPLTVFVAMLTAAVLGAWVDGIFGGFVGVMIAIPAAATIHVLCREIWNSTRPPSGQLASALSADDDVTPPG
jgi:predicted PurR-regulated permease PerM